MCYVLCVVCVSRAGASAERAGGQRGGSTVAPSRQAHSHPCPDRAHVVNAALRAVQLFHRKPRVTQIISTSLVLVELLLCSVAERAGRYFLRDLGLSEFQLRLASLRVVCAMCLGSRPPGFSFITSLFASGFCPCSVLWAHVWASPSGGGRRGGAVPRAPAAGRCGERGRGRVVSREPRMGRIVRNICHIEFSSLQ